MEIIDEYVGFRDDLSSTYHIPVDANFTAGRLSKVPWKTGRDRNFFEILYYLAYYGPLSVNEMVKLSSRHKMPSVGNKYTIIHKLIHGSSTKKIAGLESKGVVERVTGKKIKKYGLSTFGIFFAIEVLFDFRVIRRFILKQIKEKKGYAEQPETVINVLAKNYPDKIPFVFDVIDILKEHDKIDLSMLYRIVKGRVNTSSKLISEGIVPYAQKDMQIATLFYEKHVHWVFEDYDNSTKITPDIDKFIEKMFDDMKTIAEIELLMIKKTISKRRRDGKANAIQNKISKLVSKTEPRIREGVSIIDGKVFLDPEILDNPDVRKVLRATGKIK